MTEKSRNKLWSRDRKIAFGMRLAKARRDAGFGARADAIKAIAEKTTQSWRNYYFHENGERVPNADEIIHVYADVFGVTADWLLVGDQPDPQSSVKVNGTAGINQPHENKELISSKLENIRYYPILSASQIDIHLKGKEAPMPREHLPAPKSLMAGPNSFAFEIPSTDLSMLGEGTTRQFSPSSHVVIDPDQSIIPGKYALVQLPGFEYPVVRMVRAKSPISSKRASYPYTLIAANSAFAAIECRKRKDCRILGRVILTMQAI